ncbi:XrtA/PEP-CTERM system histidine kinase PrsK [Sphingomicrobium sediminis]|uniref:histidine kinase n=1 Tax=Sphingomicrobium sediminis TaxID=2950949 RepID=A0A9X2J2G8_9SPHN|nr:XrtA/PEP-CTERM system histidine kinase PrsK [Sphingomicrobium sediminis]MCM8556271.1 PEP-CTERM system histidine kinase PrsK [Sphingomicrobium sediminis]
MNEAAQFWSHIVAASLFALLVLWQLFSGPRSQGQRTLVAAMALTSLWAWLEAMATDTLLTYLAETTRNLVWVGLLHQLAMNADPERRQKGLKLVYGAVAAVLGLSIVVSLTHTMIDPEPAQQQALIATALLLRILAAAGGLILVHNIYGQAAPGSRTAIRFAMLALAGLWFIDLNTYTIAYLSADAGDVMLAWRGAAVALLAPLFALGARTDEGWRIKLSRAATFQSLSLLGICAYFAVMAVLATILRGSGDDWAGGIAVTLLSILVVGAMVIMPSPRARSWAKVKIAKHFFEHRYDYRTEWLRFTDTIGGDGSSKDPLGRRIVRAFAEMLDAPGGCLLVRDEHDGLKIAGEWEWPGEPFTPPARLFDDAREEVFWTHVVEDSRILELTGLREGWSDTRDMDAGPPHWLLRNEHGWVGIPLVHDRQLAGIVILAQPDFMRALDWEDFDLLRTAGRQAASALAEAVSQDALAKAQRFEEFNRRFAFIMHDIKNLVSQLSLLSRNAERHADNADFRADMVATLKSSVEKMNDLLARLAPQSERKDKKAVPIALDDILSFAIAAKRSQHDVTLMGETGLWAVADAPGLEQAVSHLVQNAIDASPKDAPVLVRVDGNADNVAITIADNGIGMDPEFVRSRLFEPFASTKDGGFGIGAFEARALVIGMGGRLDVRSTPGEGTTFTIHLAPADAPTMRKSA